MYSVCTQLLGKLNRGWMADAKAGFRMNKMIITRNGYNDTHTYMNISKLISSQSTELLDKLLIQQMHFYFFSWIQAAFFKRRVE